MRRRRLNEDERRLWRLVAGSVRPLAGTIALEPEPPAPVPAAAPPAEPPSGPPPPRPPPAATPPGPIDRRTRTRLARGSLALDGRLDLHGLTQRDAHSRLKRFLAETQAAGGRLVLVITGKGSEPGDPAGGRGVLRRAVPHWLAAPEFRGLVTGFDEAHRSHGGAGALYVRVRRRRER